MGDRVGDGDPDEGAGDVAGGADVPLDGADAAGPPVAEQAVVRMANPARRPATIRTDLRSIVPRIGSVPRFGGDAQPWALRARWSSADRRRPAEPTATTAAPATSAAMAPSARLRQREDTPFVDVDVV
jgi:hypothetical protein